MNFIELKGVSKSYSELDKALSSVNMSVGRGELISIMGESGAGKTSLLNILGLVDKPSSGDYIFEGQSISNYNEQKRTLFRRQKLGFIFQFFNLLPSLDVTDNVAVPLHLNGVKDYKEVVREKLAQVGILELKDRPINTLSGGQMQRVAIARAIAHNPSLILADEPTGNLDSKTAESIMQLLVRLKKEENVTIIMATHSQQASFYADKVLNIVDGCLG